MPESKTNVAVAAAPSSKEQERKLIDLLKSDASLKEKVDACRELARIGTKEAVPALAALLGDEKLSHMARYGLEPIPDPAVDEAFRDALGKLKGRPLVGVIGSIGVRRDTLAVGQLSKLLDNPQPHVAEVSARTLGKIGTPKAAKALEAALPGAQGSKLLAVCEGLLCCAESFASNGQRREARAIYDRLRSLDAPHQVRAAGLRGAILVRRRRGLRILVEALQGDDFAMVAAAARTAQEMRGRQVTQTLVSELGNLSTDKQILVIQTLAERADPEAVPALVDVAKSGSKPARLAAIRAFPEIGDPSARPVLEKLAKDRNSEIAQAARESLAAMQGL